MTFTPEQQTALRHLKLQVQRRLNQDLHLANRFFGREFPVPSVSFAVRGLKAGVAYLQRNEVRFNPILLLENGQQFIDTVVPHELAHLLVYHQFGRVAPHGREWRQVMEQVLGVPAETYHCFDVQNVRGKTFAYRCQCQTHQLSTRRHNAIWRDGRQYICRQCKSPLTAVHSA